MYFIAVSLRKALKFTQQCQILVFCNVGVCPACRCLHSQLGTKSCIRLFLTHVTYCWTQKKGNRLLLLFYLILFALSYCAFTHSPIIVSPSGFWSICEDTSRGGKEGEEEQADAGQRWVQEDDGGCEAHTQVTGQSTFTTFHWVCKVAGVQWDLGISSKKGLIALPSVSELVFYIVI